jgi:serine/threonine protein kinase
MWQPRKRGAPDFQPGEVLGPFRLEEVLGEGAMGIVFRAVREPGGETVALKLLKKELAGDETYRRRFLHEARAASEVANRHLVPIVEAGELDGRPYLAVRYIQGRSLEARIKDEGTLSLPALLRVAADVGAGLDALHEQGIVHRDIKSSNIMLDDDGNALVTDFGLAKGPAYTVLTRPGRVVGTLDYMAPELIKGQPGTPATDIYSFGCVVFECIAGMPPFGHKGAFQVAVAHLEEEPPDPCASRGDLPSLLSTAVLSALAKDPADRPTTGTAYANILRVAARSTDR